MTQTTSERVKEIREINYLSKDFDSFKVDLIDFAKKYFPDEWQDFSEASGGMALLEMVAYLGDSLAFLLDRQVNEGFIDRAIEGKNIYSLAQNMGYKPRFITPAVTTVNVSATFKDASSGAAMFTLKKGTRISTNFAPSTSFELIQDVDFSSSTNRTHSKSAGAIEATYSVSGVSALAGESRLFSYTAPATPIPFRKIRLPDKNITEITSLSSSDGFEWFEVDNLAQETIFYGDVNVTSSSADVPHILRLKRVPRRYVTQRSSKGDTDIIFGSGISSAEDSEIIPNPEDFVLPPTLRGAPAGFTPIAVDSSNFLKTRTLGIAPKDVIIDINYRIGGGLATNVGRGTLTRFTNRILSFSDPAFESNNGNIISAMLDTLSITNPLQATGGQEIENATSIKQNALSFFNAQNRAVTLQDYQVRVLSMPGSFGSVFRSYARKDPTSALGVELILAAKNSRNEVIPPAETLKNNIETYIKQFKSFSDSVRLSDAEIVNIGVDFSIVASQNINSNEALLEAFILLKDLLSISNTNFNDTLVIADFTSRLQSSNKIRSVAGFKFTNKAFQSEGRQYSNTSFDIPANTVNGIVTFPENTIWEVKFPNADIIGRTV
tara:strand:+ start:647 stop:2467 length:1821 start_codon:yes stop_codon:yes gene_type:complete